MGNELDGAFSGSFPSGNGAAGSDFVEDLGTKTLVAPVFTSFQMTAATDTGIAGDQNTMDTQPVFIGQVFSPFPGTVAGLPVTAQFNSGIIPTTTSPSGSFTVTAPPLPEGLQSVMLVVGQPGLTSSQQHSFRIDTTAPQVTGSSLPNGATINQLQSLSLTVVDQSNPTTGPLATPSIVVFPAIDPASASNVSNYSLTLNNADGTQTNESQFITSATFVATAPVTSGGFITAYTGTINLTFGTGLPAGSYTFTVHTAGGLIPGLVDAAGNPISQDFTSTFTLQSQPVFITNLQMQNTGVTIGGPRSYYELGSTVPASQASPTSPTAPPTSWAINLSNALPFVSAGFYNNKVQLIGSADTAGGTPDGNFGNLGEGGLGSTGSGFHIVGTTVTLQYQDSSGNWINADASHPGTRLLMSLTSGTLPADYYQVYIPNQLEPGNIDTRIHDVYGNQLDGEFLGNPTANGSYQDLLNTGVIRNGMSGDGIAGGAFMTGFVVVPAGQHHLCPARLRGRSASALHSPRRQPGQALFNPGAGGRPQHRPGQPEPRSQRRPELEPVFPLGL